MRHDNRNAIVESAQPIVSFAHGAGNGKRLKESFNLMFRWALIAGLACSAIMFFGARYVTMLFLETSEPAYAICTAGLPLFSTGILFIILNVVLVGYLQSVEQSTRATVFTLLRGFILVIPCFIFLPKKWINKDVCNKKKGSKNPRNHPRENYHYI